MGKNLPANEGDADSVPGLGRSPGERNGNPTPVFLSGKSHGQRSLVGCGPRVAEGHQTIAFCRIYCSCFSWCIYSLLSVFIIF